MKESVCRFGHNGSISARMLMRGLCTSGKRVDRCRTAICGEAEEMRERIFSAGFEGKKGVVGSKNGSCWVEGWE